jgi:predicted dehydrogenase
MGTRHATNARADGHEVVAGADVVPEVRRTFAEEFDVPTYEEFEEMFAAEALDAVVVTTPNAFHAPAATAALESGYDVLCEKPLADDLDGAERIAGAAERSEGFCMVGFHNRFTTSVRLFEDLRADGRFGELRHVEANKIRRRGIPGVGSWFTDPELSGGGCLIDIGVHAIDLALHLLDYPEVLEVSGVTRSDFGHRADYADPDGWGGNWDTEESDSFEVDDSVTALLRCADGTTVSLDVAWATERPANGDFVVRGTEAGARLSMGADELEVFDTGTGAADHYADTELRGSLDRTGWEAETAAFLDAVVAGEPPADNTVEQALTVQRVIDAIYRSDADGEAKTIDR